MPPHPEREWSDRPPACLPPLPPPHPPSLSPPSLPSPPPSQSPPLTPLPPAPLVQVIACLRDVKAQVSSPLPLSPPCPPVQVIACLRDVKAQVSKTCKAELFKVMVAVRGGAGEEYRGVLSRVGGRR